MKKITYSSVVGAILLGVLTGCTNSSTEIQRHTPLEVAKDKTAKFARDLLAGKDTTASMFTKDTSYNASSQSSIFVNSKGDIAKGGTLMYFDENNHSVKLVATDKNELTASIDYNDDGLFSDDETFIAIAPSELGEFIDADEGGDQMTFEDYKPLSDWLNEHSAMDTTEVYIILPSKHIAPNNNDEVTFQMIEIDIEANKKQILDFINENNLTRNDSINGVLENGIESMFQTNLTKEKIESLLEKYDENALWIELLTNATIIE